MNKKIKYLIYLFLFLFLYLFINYFIINTFNFSNLKNFLSENQRYIIKKYIFPYRYISTLENKIYENEYKLFTKDSLIAYSDTYQAELNFQISNNDIDTLKLKDTSLSNGLILKKNIFKSGFYSGIGINFSGSGYIDFYKNNIFVLSSRGSI